MTTSFISFGGGADATAIGGPLLVVYPISL